MPRYDDTYSIRSHCGFHNIADKKELAMGWIVIIGTLLGSLLGYLWAGKHKDD